MAQIEVLPVAAGKDTSCPLNFSCATKALAWPFQSLWNNGILCVVLAQLFNAVCGILITALADLSMPFFQTLAVRSIFGALLFGIISKAAGLKGAGGSRSLWVCFLLFAAFGAFHACALFIGFELLPAGDAMSYSNLVPVFTFGLVWLLGWESINWKIFGGVLICTSGAVFISHPPILFGGDSDWTSSRILGLIIELIGSASGGAAFVMLSKVGDTIHSLVATCWLYWTTALMCAADLIVGYPNMPIWTISWRQGVLLMSFSAASALASLLSVRGFQKVSSICGTSMLTLGSILSYILGYFFLSQEITIWAIIGTFLILSGVYLVSVARSRPQENDSEIGKEVELT